MIIVYKFCLGYGGIGDFIKYMKIAKYESEKEKLEFKINLDHPLNKFIKIKDKYIFKNEDKNIKIVIPKNYYYRFEDDSYSINIRKINVFDFNPFDYFYFTEDIYKNLNILKIKNNIPDNYEAIHVRLGDSKMHSTDKNKKDDRIKNLEIYKIINNIITENENKIFVLFTDNEKLKEEIFKKNNNVKIINIKIIHTSECYSKKNRDFDLKNNLCDFIFLSNSNKIHSISYSGFPIVASWINSTKIKIYY